MSEHIAPRSPELLRVGDRERAEAADRLSAHAAAGRLSVEELEQRLDLVHSAVLARELHAVEADLPSADRRPRPSPPAPRVPIAIAVLLAAALATTLAGHLIPPLFIAALLLWRAGVARPGRSAGSAPRSRDHLRQVRAPGATHVTRRCGGRRPAWARAR